jgi:hypothetical protein
LAKNVVARPSVAQNASQNHRSTEFAMFSSLKVRSQFLLLSGVSLSLFVISLLVALFALQASQTRFHEFIDRDAVRLAAFNEMYA